MAWRVWWCLLYAGVCYILVLAAIPDHDTFYDITDQLEAQGMETVCYTQVSVCYVQVLAAVPDQDTFYDITDQLKAQGMGECGDVCYMQVFVIYRVSVCYVQVLAAVPDQDTFYDITDQLEAQGMESVVKRYMNRKGGDIDLLEQFQIYESMLKVEDGEEDASSINLDNVR